MSWVSRTVFVLAASLGVRMVLADTGIGIDTQQGNKLDPSSGEAYIECDPEGRSNRTSIEHRTPTGFLYPCPELPAVETPLGLWTYHGVIDFGYVYLSGTTQPFGTLYQRYTNWRDGIVLERLDLHFDRAADGSYVDVRGSSISPTNQYYKITVGRAGSYAATAFIRDVPNVVSTDSRPIWNGVGSNNLTLPATLTPGGSTPAQVAAVSAATPLRTLEVDRQKEGLGLSEYLTPHIQAYATATLENREGERPFGGEFFFAFTGLGGVMETVKPIDDHTINTNIGIRYADSTWHYEVGYSGSFYRDRYKVFDYENPFISFPYGAASHTTTYNGTPTDLYQGQWSMEPDNNMNQGRASLSHVLPMNGTIGIAISGASFEQDEGLIPQINCTGQFGIIATPGVGGAAPVAGAAGGNPNLYNCSQWNSVADLSRPTADMDMATYSGDLNLLLRPTSEFTLRSNLKWYEQDYIGEFTDYNPVTGLYGYIAENGAFCAFIPAPGCGGGLAVPTNDGIQIKSIPYSYTTREYNGGFDYRPNRQNTFGVTYTANRYDPKWRERSEVTDNSVKLTWNNRTFDWLTLRANNLYLKQTGDKYNFNPYYFAYANNLAESITPQGGILARTSTAMHKFDLADRTEDKVDVMASTVPTVNQTLTASFRGDFNQYPTLIGRQNLQYITGMVQWEWQPSVRTNVSVFYSYDRSKLHQAEVADQGSLQSPADPGVLYPGTEQDPTYGGLTYQLASSWWLTDTEWDHTVGVNFRKLLPRGVRIDATYGLIFANSQQNYTFASGQSLAYPADAAILPNSSQFPDISLRINSLTLAVTYPISDRLSVRLYDYYETSQYLDWHYLNFTNSLVYGNRVYTDEGPQPYSNNLIGLFVAAKL